MNLYRHGDSRPSPSVLRNVLEQKCAYKAVAVPTLEALTPHRADLEAMWHSMLGHQLPVLPPVETFWDALPEILAWIMSEAEAPLRARIEPGSAEIAIRSRVLPMSVPLRARPALEIIRFAAANHLCVDLAYDGGTGASNPIRCGGRKRGTMFFMPSAPTSGAHRSYRVDRMQGATVTAQPFVPRYLVELTSEGPLPVTPSAARSGGAVGLSSIRPVRSGAPADAPSSSGGGPTYVFRCTVCGKTFERKTMDGSLNAHKHPRGYECPGRIGVYVRTKF